MPEELHACQPMSTPLAGVLLIEWAAAFARTTPRIRTMKIKNSLKALKARHRDNQLVRRKGRIYIINKQNPRFKARQG